MSGEQEARRAVRSFDQAEDVADARVTVSPTQTVRLAPNLERLGGGDAYVMCAILVLPFLDQDKTWLLQRHKVALSQKREFKSQIKVCRLIFG